MTRVRTHTNPLSINHRFDKNLLSQLEKTKPLDIEIGFGRGVFLRNWAKKNKSRNVIGIEVRNPIVKILQEKLISESFSNTLIFHGNGTFFLEDSVEDESIDRLFIFHPDPWFKKRHQKRRIIQQGFLKLILKKLKPNGLLCVSTDVEPLWNAMLENILENKFEITNDQEFWKESYNTHWQEFSKKDQRSLYQNSFRKN